MIDTLLDNDYYAFTMSNAIHAAGDDLLPVRYEFRNRTFAVPLANRLSLGLLREMITDVRQLRFRPYEIDWLRGQKVFSEEWLSALPDYRLPEVEIDQLHGHLIMRYEGPWSQAIFWESILLAVVNEMYYSRFGTFLAEGSQRLTEKIEYLKDRGTLHFSEFGTRRRFSKAWQHRVVHELMSEVPDLLAGTSNVSLARELDLRPIGTMAHQLFMVYTALEMSRNPYDRGQYGDPIGRGIHTVLRLWSDEYGEHPELMTALPDTYGTDAFIKRATTKDLALYGTFRQDSGDAIERSTQLMRYAIETLGKVAPLIVPSDSLDVRRMSVIEDHMFGEAMTLPSNSDPHLSFGWGTDLTNDLGYQPLSIVIKPSHVLSNRQWLPCVKFSDDQQKITGESQGVLQYVRLLSQDSNATLRI